MPSQSPLFPFFEEEQEDVKQVIKDLNVTCQACHLSILHPQNVGLIQKGNPLAKIAVIAEAPGDTETERGMPLIGRSGQEFDRWMRRIKLNPLKDMWISNVVQCQPNKVMKEGKPTQDNPSQTEITACFGPRA
ncbi:MAG: uracil-DNA glycosylase family protein, partial [Janthinobacterium lividum]